MTPETKFGIPQDADVADDLREIAEVLEVASGVVETLSRQEEPSEQAVVEAHELLKNQPENARTLATLVDPAEEYQP